MRSSLSLTFQALAAVAALCPFAGHSAPVSPPAVSAGDSRFPAPPVTPAQQADPMKVARALLDAINEQTALLRRVVDKAGGDAAAPKLNETTVTINALTRQLAAIDFTGTEIEDSYMDLMQQMFSASEEVNKQFARLKKAEAYGSESLKRAVDEANRPVFGDEGGEAEGGYAAMPASEPLTPEQQRAEVERMGELAAPDKALVDALKKVVSVPTAVAAVPALRAYVASQQALMPSPEAAAGYFENPDDPAIRVVWKPVADLLQELRAQLLRIVALDGFTTKEFDPFNDAMDEVFSLLEQTHDFWYGDVFDENFQDAVFDILDKRHAPSAPVEKSE